PRQDLRTFILTFAQHLREKSCTQSTTAWYATPSSALLLTKSRLRRTAGYGPRTTMTSDAAPCADPEIAAPPLPDVVWTDIFAAAREIVLALPSLAGRALDPDDLDNRDPEFLARAAPLFYAIGRYYFRGEGTGFEHIPTGPFIAVGNHS